MLFLGAGASRPFGIPTMSEMVFKFEERIKTKPAGIEQSIFETMRDLYSTIKNLQLKFYRHSDLESIFSVVEAIADPIIKRRLGILL